MDKAKIKKYTRAIKTTGLVLTTIATGLLGISSTYHYSARHYEQKRLDSIPAFVQYIKESKTKANEYFSDDFIDPDEARGLIKICRDIKDSKLLTDSYGFTTPSGNELRKRLSYAESQLLLVLDASTPINVIGPDGKLLRLKVPGQISENAHSELDDMLDRIQIYLQSAEHLKLIKPLTAQDRINRFVLGISRN